MSIFKASYKNKNGEKKWSKSFYIGINISGKRHRFKGLKTKRETQELKANIIKILECERLGYKYPDYILKWISRLPKNLYINLLKRGIPLQINKYLMEKLFVEYEKYLKFKGVEKIEIQGSIFIVKRITNLLEGERLSDVNDELIGRIIKDLNNGGYHRKPKRLSNHTRKKYIRTYRRFCKWLIITEKVDTKQIVKFVL